jgi:NAD(P)-dependent dehydrogenase (short-subunit alcohol dehydrogenase family)
MDKRSKFSSAFLWGAAAAGLYLGARLIAAARRYELKNRVVLITGGSRGFGLVLARQLLEKEAKVAICSRSKDQLENARKELDHYGDVLAVACDVTDESQVRNLVDNVISRFGQLDILINNAGIMQVGPESVMTTMEYEEAMKVHFWGPLYTIRACLPHFRKREQGKIINISSIGGKVAVPHMLPYSASKFALVGLSEGMQYELRRENIQVMTVVPYLMRTGSPRNITVKGDHEKEYPWFKTAGSSPVISQDPREAAKKVIDAIEHNQTHPTLSFVERQTSLWKELTPGLFGFLMTTLNRLLPESGPDGHLSKKGYDSESAASQNVHAKAGDSAALRNNEY